MPRLRCTLNACQSNDMLLFQALRFHCLTCVPDQPPFTPLASPPPFPSPTSLLLCCSTPIMSESVCVYYGKPLEPDNHTLACAGWRCEVSHTLILARVMAQYKLTSPRAACSVEGTARGRTTATSAPKPNQEKAHSQTAHSFVATPVGSAGLHDVVSPEPLLHF